MALQTKYYNAGTNSVEWKCRLIVTENSTNKDNNTSNVTLTLQFTRARSSGYGAWCGYTTSATMSIAGQSKTVTVSAFNYSSISVDDWKTVATATFDVKHNSDGALTTTAKGYWHQTYCSPNTCDVSGSITLTKISVVVGITAVTPTTTTAYPISTVTATSPVVAGNNCTITIKKNTTSVTLTHGLRYKTAGMAFPSLITTSPISATSYTWNIPKRIQAEFGISTCTIYLDTYYNGTMLGTSEATITISRDMITTSNPVEATTSLIDVNTSLDVHGSLSGNAIQENGVNITSIYAAASHSHITSSGGSLDASDSGGCWIQFSNGLQICWNKRYQSSQNMNSYTVNAVYGGYGRNFTDPKAFIDTPAITTNIDSNDYTNSQAAAITKTGFTMRHWGNHPATVSTIIYHYIAIGRWK